MSLHDASSSCKPKHDNVTLALSLFLCFGLVISYLPQILRIILKKSSLGFSPWFLLLGATSSASSFLNVVTLQWSVVQCCSELTAGQCAESALGIVQTGLQWFLFVVVFALFLFYYPREKRYEKTRTRGLRRTATVSTAGTSDDGSDADDDSSIGDIDSIGSHIAANYSTFDDAGPVQQQQQQQQPQQPASSAFQRLVPSFWPVWRGRTAEGTTTAQGGLLQVPRRSSNVASERDVLLQAPRGLRARRPRRKRTDEWTLAVALAWLTALHFLFTTLVTLLLVTSLPAHAFPPPSHDPLPVAPTPLPPSILFLSSSRLLLSRWATFLGLTGTLLACAQYIPQLVHTFKTRLVGSLSIPMMILQVPGSIFFVYSLAVRPGIEFSSLLAYISTGVLQGALLVMCICWKRRQARLGLDDFGRQRGS